MPITYVTSTHTGLVRRTNEDSYFARPPVFVVADGMGGAQAGEVASAMAARAFEYFLPQSSKPEEELAKLITRTNTSIYEYAMGDSGRTGMGTTITAAVVKGSKVSIAHVGDSRAWLLRGGRLERLTQDHSLVAEMIRGGQLTETEAATHPQRSIITRALGVDASVEVDTIVKAWEPGDIFLLASDGLHGMLSEDEIEAILAGGADLNESARSLVEAANARGGNDNITVVLFSPDGSVPGAGSTEAGSGDEAMTAPGTAGADDEEFLPEPRTLIERVRGFLASVPGTILIGVLIAAALVAGLWFSTRFAYYVGVEGRNVAIYKGVPYGLGPLSFFSLYRESAVKVDDLEPFEQDRVREGNLQSKSSAEQMLDNYIIAEKRRKDEELRVAREKQALEEKEKPSIRP